MRRDLKPLNLNLPDDPHEVEKMCRLIKRAFTVISCLWFFLVLLVLSAVGGLAWAAVHFIAKYW